MSVIGDELMDLWPDVCMVGANADVVDDVHIDIIATIATRRYGDIASMAYECIHQATGYRTLESRGGREGSRGYFHAEVYLAFCSCEARSQRQLKKVFHLHIDTHRSRSRGLDQ